jgi:hypothetical protein
MRCQTLSASVDLDRFHPVSDVIDRVPNLATRAAYAKQAIRDKLIEHKQYIARHGDDMPEIAGWRWGQEAASAGLRSSVTVRRRPDPWRRAGIPTNS